MSIGKPDTVVASIDLHRDGQVTVDWRNDDYQEMNLDDLRSVLDAAQAAFDNWPLDSTTPALTDD